MTSVSLNLFPSSRCVSEGADASGALHAEQPATRGFGHIAFNVDDVYATCAALEEAKVGFHKRPDEVTQHCRGGRQHLRGASGGSTAGEGVDAALQGREAALQGRDAALQGREWTQHCGRRRESGRAREEGARCGIVQRSQN